MPTPEQTLVAAVDELIDNEHQVSVVASDGEKISIAGGFDAAITSGQVHTLDLSTTSVTLFKAVIAAIESAGLP